MTPDQVKLLREMVLSGVPASLGDDGSLQSLGSLDARTGALIRIAVLLGLDSDASTLRWAIDTGIAAGLEESELVDTFRIVAPLVGTGRTPSALAKLLAGLDIDVLDELCDGHDGPW